MIGARASWKSALCIVDAGTAITVDAVDRDGHHLGGQIIPGLHLMADALKRGTKGMRELRIRRSDPGTGMELFSNSTEGAVPAGALNAICGGIERSLKIMRADGLRPRVIFTGGGAPRIMSAIDQKSTHCPHLVLQGLAVMLLESSR
jgi:type III pantothenate kinase